MMQQPRPPSPTILIPLVGGIMVDDLGRYIVQAKIGHHPDSSPVQVYTVSDQETGATVVAKVLTLADERESFMENVAARFQRELEIMMALHHPNIVPILDRGRSGRRMWMILPFYPAGTLMGMIERRHGAPIPVEQACALTMQMCSALHETHSQCPMILHRDIKPQNMFMNPHQTGDLLSPWGDILLGDFGIAHLLGELHLTREDKAVGTPDCMAPEQLTPRHGDEAERVDHRADIYGLGCCLYWMLSGKPPFAGSTPMAMARAHLHLQPKPLNELNRFVNYGLTVIVAKALAKHPDERFQTMLAFRRALAHFIEG